jgi:hypothetical protein
MKIGVDQDCNIELKEVFNSIVLKTQDNEKMAICMRDSGFEFNYQGQWYSAKNGLVLRMQNTDIKELNDGFGGIFVPDELSSEISPIYDVDIGVYYILHKDGSIEIDKDCQKIYLDEMSHEHLNPQEMVVELLKYIVNDCLNDKVEMSVSREKVLDISNKSYGTVVCSKAWEDDIQSKKLVINDFDDNIVMLLPEPEYFGVVCYRTNYNGSLYNYGVFGSRGTEENPVQVLRVEE